MFYIDGYMVHVNFREESLHIDVPFDFLYYMYSNATMSTYKLYLKDKYISDIKLCQLDDRIGWSGVNIRCKPSDNILCPYIIHLIFEPIGDISKFNEMYYYFSSKKKPKKKYYIIPDNQYDLLSLQHTHEAIKPLFCMIYSIILQRQNIHNNDNVYRNVIKKIIDLVDTSIIQNLITNHIIDNIYLYNLTMNDDNYDILELDLDKIIISFLYMKKYINTHFKQNSNMFMDKSCDIIHLHDNTKTEISLPVMKKYFEKINLLNKISKI